MTEQNSAPEALEDPRDLVQALLADSVQSDDVQDDPGLGDPGDAEVDGVRLSDLFEVSDSFRPVEDRNGDVIGRDSFPEVALAVALDAEPDEDEVV